MPGDPCPLADRAAPVFTSGPAGDLLDTSRPVSGVRSVSFSATDAGGGLFQAALEVDGKTMLTQLVDDNGGRCRLPFLAPVPCVTSTTGKLSFDTAALPDGPHSVRLILTYATQTNRTASAPCFGITTHGSTMLPRLFDILSPSASSTMSLTTTALYGDADAAALFGNASPNPVAIASSE